MGGIKKNHPCIIDSPFLTKIEYRMTVVELRKIYSYRNQAIFIISASKTFIRCLSCKFFRNVRKDLKPQARRLNGFYFMLTP